MKRGTVVLAVLPFTDLTGQKRRPARGEPLLTTDLLIGEADPDFKGTGLKRPSGIKLDKLFTLQKGLLLGELGELSLPLMAKVDERLRIALGLQ